MDGKVIIEGLPFATCNRCGQLIVLGDDGLVCGEHAVPCGAICELSAGGDTHNTCSGWCDRCRTVITGCSGDPDRPCGRNGCEECGVHIDASEVDGTDYFLNKSACGLNRSISRFAWTWARVTCGGCLTRRPSTHQDIATVSQ